MPSSDIVCENLLGVGCLGVRDIGRDHRHFQTMPPDDRDQLRQILPHSLRLDVAALAYRDVDAVEADLGGARRQRVALQKLQVFREDQYFLFLSRA